MLQVQPIDVSEAFAFVAAHHRHHRPPQGYKLCLGANDGEKVIGVLIAGRPVARLLDDGLTLEVTRCCTDGTRNACSILYAAAWRAAKALGFTRMITYTLPEEGGASLRATGWECVAETEASPWTNKTRKRADDHPICPKHRWEVKAAGEGKRFRVELTKDTGPDLFAGVE